MCLEPLYMLSKIEVADCILKSCCDASTKNLLLMPQKVYLLFLPPRPANITQKVSLG